MAACENCWNLRHYKCRDPECSCSVCVGKHAARVKQVPKSTTRVRKSRAKVQTDKPKAPRAPGKWKPVNPGSKTHPGTQAPFALTVEERTKVYELWQQKLTIAEIVKSTGFTRSRVRAEVARCNRGWIPVEA